MGAVAWDGSWAWSLPLIVVTVIFHVIGLGFINAEVIRALGRLQGRRNYLPIFAVVMGITTLLATVLHGLEASMWGAAYRLLGAVPDNKTAILYSLNAMTSYGHTEIYLAGHWQLMGALEALNGLLLFGLTTAFLYGTIQRVWPAESRNVPHVPWHHSPNP